MNWAIEGYGNVRYCKHGEEIGKNCVDCILEKKPTPSHQGLDKSITKNFLLDEAKIQEKDQ